MFARTTLWVRSLRRLVGAAMLLTAFSASVEILRGDCSPASGGPTAIEALHGSSTQGDDCCCLCACGCRGAQVLVAPELRPALVAAVGVLAREVAVLSSIPAVPPQPPFHPPQVPTARSA